MFVSQTELDYRKAVSTHIGRDIFGRKALYYHLVDDVSSNPDKPPLQVCGTPCVVAGLAGEVGQVPFLIDLAFPTAVPEIFILIEKLEVASVQALGPGLDPHDVAVVEYKNADRIIDTVNEMQDLREKPKARHLSLVVDNVNTVENLAETLSSTMPAKLDTIWSLLQDCVSQSIMPSAKTTHYRHRVPRIIKAADDGDFLDQILSASSSGFYQRDALRKGEVYVALILSNYPIVIGLRSGFAVFRDTDGKTKALEDNKVVVAREELEAALRSLSL